MTVDDGLRCGKPIRRRAGESPCILEAGHKAWWCQDEEALRADQTLARVEQRASEARAVLGLFGCAMGVVDTRRWIYHRLWNGELQLDA